MSGELGGRPIPYPRRKNSTVVSLSHLLLTELYCFLVLSGTAADQVGTLSEVRTWMLVSHGWKKLR